MDDKMDIGKEIDQKMHIKRTIWICEQIKEINLRLTDLQKQFNIYIKSSVRK